MELKALFFCCEWCSGKKLLIGECDVDWLCWKYICENVLKTKPDLLNLKSNISCQKFNNTWAIALKKWLLIEIVKNRKTNMYWSTMKNGLQATKEADFPWKIKIDEESRIHPLFNVILSKSCWKCGKLPNESKWCQEACKGRSITFDLYYSVTGYTWMHPLEWRYSSSSRYRRFLAQIATVEIMDLLFLISKENSESCQKELCFCRSMHTNRILPRKLIVF